MILVFEKRLLNHIAFECNDPERNRHELRLSLNSEKENLLATHCRCLYRGLLVLSSNYWQIYRGLLASTNLTLLLVLFTRLKGKKVVVSV